MIMSFDEISNTSLGLGLDLGLGLHEHNHQAENCMKKKEENYYDPSKCNINTAYPILSLTLGPIIIDDDQQEEASKIIELASSNNYSPSAVSNSFSNSSSIIKKEKDQLLGEEFEVDEKIPSSHDVDDIIIEDGNPRKKLRLSKEQSAILEENFKEHSTLNPQKQELAKKLNLRARQVEVWFQNRRARTKLKQTESECELLRKCCETLTEENKRLQKELQELRSIQTTTTTAVPFYMHIPSAATLTICPSCERSKLICGDANNIINYNNASSSSSPNTTTSTTFLIASSNPHNHNHNHFYKNNNYPFPHSPSSSMLAS